jgi:hypothetical protein
MNNKKFVFVIPINRLFKESFFESYYTNFVKFDKNIEDIKFFVIDDFSPFFNENLKILKKCGLPFEYWSIRSQIEFFKKEFGGSWEKYWSVIPHKTDACRSFGYLIAALWGAEVIITMDDDNYAINDALCVEFDYLGSHDAVNSVVEITEASSSSGWFNTISMLKTEPEKELYARGYPYSRRYGKITYNKRRCKIVMNVGLWTGYPDVDSLTILYDGSLNGLPRTKTVGFKSRIKRLVLAKGTFAPLNTANTAYSKELLPITYDTFQGAQIGELKLDRFGDIWCNLFVKKILDQTEGKISIGVPLVEHRKEPRNTIDDLKKEFWGIIISEKLFNIVEQLDLHSTHYADLYQELIEGLRSTLIKEFKDFPPLQKYFHKLFFSMLNWLDIVEKLKI